MNATTSASANIASTLSVNPVSKTLGCMSPELAASLRRGGEAIVRRTRGIAKVLSAIFAVNASVKSSAFLLVARALFGAMFIVMGLCSLNLLPLQVAFRLPEWAGWLEVAGGAALILGLFSRISMATLTVCYAMMAWERFGMGLFPQTAILCALGTLLNCIAGPGRYSLDMLLYKGLTRLTGGRYRHPDPKMTHDTFSRLNKVS